jgi:hypothetical protein
MTINYANGAAIRTQAMALHAGHQTILRNERAAGGFWGGAGSSARRGFITGSRVQTAGSHMSATDSAVGSGWV